MTEVNPAGWFQNLTTHTAEQFRSYFGALGNLATSSGSFRTREGVHPALGAQLAVTQNGTPNMSVNIGSGYAFIRGTESSTQGTYTCYNNATVNLAIGASDPSLNRIDLVVGKVQDAFYSGGTNAWSLAVVAGTPAASPSAPTAPNNSITLAQVAINAGVSSITNANITDKRNWAVGIGGVVLTSSTTRPTVIYEGTLAYELDTDRVIKYNGTNWHQIGIHVCTSGTRPSGPFAGMEIYETDTNLKYFWNGTKWMREVQHVYKTADQSWVSNTTQSAITDLGFAAETNSAYVVNGVFYYSADAAGDIAPKMTWPASATGVWSGLGLDSGQTTSIGTLYMGASTSTTPVLIPGGAGSSTIQALLINGYFATAGTAGTFQFTAAQSVSNANATWVYHGSFFEVKQVS